LPHGKKGGAVHGINLPSLCSSGNDRKTTGGRHKEKKKASPPSKRVTDRGRINPKMNGIAGPPLGKKTNTKKGGKKKLAQQKQTSQRLKTEKPRRA